MSKKVFRRFVGDNPFARIWALTTDTETCTHVDLVKTRVKKEIV